MFKAAIQQKELSSIIRNLRYPHLPWQSSSDTFRRGLYPSPLKELGKGKLHFSLSGTKLHGEWYIRDDSQVSRPAAITPFHLRA